MFKEIFDWSEVWALMIPIAFIIQRRKIPPYLRPVKWYVWVAFILNLFANLIWYRNKLHIANLPVWLESNNFLYNLHSITRLLLFSWFFILLNQRFMHRVKIILPVLFIVLTVINFTFYENFFNYNMLSSRLLATEAAILLFYCLQYFIFLLIEDHVLALQKQPGFWIVTGLSIYVSANFFIFLFYNYLLEKKLEIFAVDIWDVHNVAFIILCIGIAINFKQVEVNEY
jgi:hypothetical protein